MVLNQDNKIELESLGSLLLDMAQERSVKTLLKTAAKRLIERPYTARIRIWLMKQGDICPSCIMSEACHDKKYCLHLITSTAGQNADSEEIEDETPPPQRLPLNLDDIGRIATTGKSAENIRAKNENYIFCGLPLSYKWVVLGVLAIYTPERILPEEIVWLRLIANNAGIAIANARAFLEIERLKKQLEIENAYLREELDEVREYGDIIGQSPSLLNVLKQIDLVAPTNASVLILGDSGTGKELVTREIHRRSPRQDRPMIKVNCASIPRELYESEFFGHAKGAFTGAVSSRTGRFEAANGGTLFLDEVGEIPLELQSKLLRVLQEGQYERVGEEVTREVDVRIIAATNKNLLTEVKARRFRQDLYYRLNVFPVTIEPLRNRKDDIPLLAAHFVKQIAAKMDCPLPRLTKANVLALQAYDWPGNVRELQNIIERAVITSSHGSLRFDLPTAAEGKPASHQRELVTSRTEQKVYTEFEMLQIQRKNILAALQQCSWKIYGADGTAALLGLNPTTLVARIKKLSLKKPGS
jgi:transcriptional regulator with GAF, ATPase, and Fis domain